MDLISHAFLQKNMRTLRNERGVLIIIIVIIISQSPLVSGVIAGVLYAGLMLTTEGPKVLELTAASGTPSVGETSSVESIRLI